MISSFSPGDYQPVTYFRGRPVHVTTILLGLCILGLIIGTIAYVAPMPALLNALMLEPGQLWTRGQLWRILTYTFIDIPNLFSIFSLLFLFIYSREVESYLGKTRATVFLSLLILTPVVLLTAWWLMRWPSSLQGPWYLSLGVLVAFATLYPRVEIFWIIQMRWLAIGCLVLGSIPLLAMRDLPALTAIWGIGGVSFGYIRWLQHGSPFPNIRIPNPFRRRPKLRVLPDPKSVRDSGDAEDSLADVDAILDKIAKRGLGSLTAKERKILDKGREELIKREQNKK